MRIPFVFFHYRHDWRLASAAAVIATWSLVPSPAAALPASPAPPARACRAATPDTPAPAVWLERSVSALGLREFGDRIRVARMTTVTTMDYQSDRMYPPFLFGTNEQRQLVAWQPGLVRHELSIAGPGFAIVSDSLRQAAVSPRGAQIVPRMTPNLVDERAMDPWTALGDWRRATDVRVEGVCRYRDYDRLVLRRGTGAAAERLLLDPRTAYPVMLERQEPHSLWGDARVEYLWSIWTPVAATRSLAPQYTFRMVDGVVNLQRHSPSFAAMSADSLSLLQVPANSRPLMDLPPQMPDTVRVGPTTFLLRTPLYTNVVTLQRDTVYVLDAQVSEARARSDSSWIARLFPGRHPVVVVVTDLAWPHIAGVRFWVAQGATIATHPMNRTFLESVVNRAWTLEPDLLTRQRQRAPLPFRFRALGPDAALAGGAVRVHGIDGAGSEGALMVYLRGDQFLWTGDFVQPGAPDSFSRVYAEEVVAAVARAGIMPQRYAGMHSPLNDWARVPRLAPAPDAARPVPD